MKRLLFAGAVIGLLAGAAVSLPLSWVAGERLDALDPDAAALGTVWDGHVAHIAGLPPIHTRVRGTDVAVEADGAGLTLDGTAGPSGITDMSLATPVRALSRFDPRLTGLAGDVSATDVTLRFEDGGCVEGSGTARTDALSRNAAAWSWRGPELSGPVTCEDGAVVVTMSGEEAGAGVQARVEIDPAGIYTTTVDIRTAQPEAAALLPLLGFQRQSTGCRLQENGRWQ